MREHSTVDRGSGFLLFFFYFILIIQIYDKTKGRKKTWKKKWEKMGAWFKSFIETQSTAVSIEIALTFYTLAMRTVLRNFESDTTTPN